MEKIILQFKKFINSIHTRIIHRRFKAGFMWATEQYYFKHVTVDDLIKAVEASKEFGEYDDYDMGVERVIGILIHIRNYK